jgi:DNA-binding NtrC family response regulator
MHVPPLRERQEEIPVLARHFIQSVSADHHWPAPSLTSDAEDALVCYHWPGNVRELRHVIERILFAGVNRIDVLSLPSEVLNAADAPLTPIAPRRPTLEEVERRYIALTLQLTHGNQTRAAAILGISRKGLWEKRKRFALE